MAKCARKTMLECLREARLQSGFASRDMAAFALHRSPETIGRHERGEVPLSQEDLLDYADSYNKPDLLLRFCADCPINSKLRDSLQGFEFTLAAIRLKNRLKNAADIANNMLEIADDGKVSSKERPAFIKALRDGNDIAAAFEELKLWALASGVITLDELKEGLPAATGTALK